MKRAKSKRPKDCPFVGKGGLKLQFALEHFGVDVRGLVCADLGCNVGGFTDCLIQNGAAKVYSVDTSYGLLAWKLRTDPRVVVFERTNVLHWTPPEKLDFVVSDLGWTRQEKALPVIAEMLKPEGRALSLVKPQYQAPDDWLARNVLPEERIPEVMELVRSQTPKELEILGEARSPYLGHGGNAEVWLLVTRESVPSPREGEG
ncbi:MAG TPA: SAM-dependent methyltransferase [Armatimonadota bacterium]|nr:SAM-dependent methyltransferase [Armatimonadota bacterium]